MQWLQDKKNLPFVIGGVVVIILAAGAFLFMQMKGPSPAPTPDQNASMPGGMPPGAGGSPGMPTPGAPAMPGAAPAPMPGAPAAPATPGAPGAPTASAVPASAPGDATAAAGPLPVERWRDDPFAPFTSGKKKRMQLRPKLDVPMLARIFPPPPPTVEDIPALRPQPPRRVAGILFSDRINALIQTPDGWETVKPGDKLRDGTLVERIERDRVVLRTNDDRPRLIEVRLAATVSPIQERAATPAVSEPTIRGTRGMPPGGFPPMPGRAM